jgi:hypothetical protein
LSQHINAYALTATHRPRLRVTRASNNAEQRGLSAAIQADYPESVRIGDRKRDIREQRPAGATRRYGVNIKEDHCAKLRRIGLARRTGNIKQRPAEAAEQQHPAEAAEQQHPAEAAEQQHPAEAAKQQHPAEAAEQQHPAEAAETVSALQRLAGEALMAAAVQQKTSLD